MQSMPNKLWAVNVKYVFYTIIISLLGITLSCSLKDLDVYIWLHHICLYIAVLLRWEYCLMLSETQVKIILEVGTLIVVSRTFHLLGAVVSTPTESFDTWANNISLISRSKSTKLFWIIYLFWIYSSSIIPSSQILSCC